MNTKKKSKLKVKWEYCECGCKCSEVSIAGFYLSIYDSLKGWFYLTEGHNARAAGKDKLTEEQVDREIERRLKAYYEKHKQDFKMLEEAFGGN